MAYTQPSDVSSSIEKRVSTIVTETLIQEAVVLGAVRDRTAEVGPGMDQLKIQLLNQLALQNVPTDGTEMTAQTITSLTADLDLDQHVSYPFAIGDKVAIESKLNLVQEQIANGARVHAANIDDYILGQLKAGVSTATPDHLIAFDANDALVDMREAKKLLDEANVPKFDRFWIASPGWMQKLLASNNVIRANEFGSTNAIQAGFVAKVYDFNILETSSSELADGEFIAMQRDTYAFARHITPKFERERRVLKQADEYALTQKFGGIVTDPSGVRIVYGTSTGS
jgi:hypothetical protein